MSEVIQLPKEPEDRLSIERLPMGGYVVTRTAREFGYEVRPAFAASTIDEAMTWVKHAMTDCQWPMTWPVGEASA